MNAAFEARTKRLRFSFHFRSRQNGGLYYTSFSVSLFLNEKMAVEKTQTESVIFVRFELSRMHRFSTSNVGISQCKLCQKVLAGDAMFKQTDKIYF